MIAEDDNVMRLILEKHLSNWGYAAVTVKDGEEALREMEGEEPPRLMLLDWEMPRVDGVEVCRRLRARDNSDPPYIIMVTAKDNAGDMVTCLDAGASDCIRKPFDRDELLARMRVGERTLQLQAQLNEARRKMTQLAMYDALTGIYNRRAAGERLEQELARFRRGGSPLHVGLADLDHFKAVNDQHGHQTGDAVITAFVQGVRSVMRSSDVIGRWGGEEFLIIAPDSATHPNPLFDRILEHTRTLEAPAGEAGVAVRFTVSIGTACAESGETMDDFLLRTDKALYRAKDEGRDRICHAEPGPVKTQTTKPPMPKN